MHEMLHRLKEGKKQILIAAMFLGFLGWWLALHVGLLQANDAAKWWFGATYGSVALLGGIWALGIARKWGGRRSLVGRAIMAFALGLLAQEFGQLVYSYYATMSQVAAPYPSLGDIGFLGSVILFTYGTWLLARVSGIRISIKRFDKKIVVLLMSLGLMSSVYPTFIKSTFSWEQPFLAISNIGYLTIEATYITLAVLILLQARKSLGGIMRNKILLLVLIFPIHHLADLNFFFQANRQTYSVANYGDLLYLASYTLITLALLNISTRSLNVVRQESASAITQSNHQPMRVSERIVPKRKKLVLDFPS